jgi:hypothetical protein
MFRTVYILKTIAKSLKWQKKRNSFRILILRRYRY